MLHVAALAVAATVAVLAGAASGEAGLTLLGPAQVAPCPLLAAADPSQALGGPVGPATDLGAQCMAWLEADATKFVGLALPPRTPSTAGLTLDGFWERYREGLDILGVGRSELRQAPGLGELAVYADYEGGMQLWVLWAGGSSAIVTVGGVASEAGLEWALALARSVIDAS